MEGPDNDDNIDTVCGIVALDPINDRALITNALRSLNSVERVVDDYFTSESSFRSKYSGTWNDSAFSGDRDDSQDQSVFSYLVQGPDQVPTPQSNTEQGLQPFPRPPSRTNNTTPLNGLTDYAAQNAGVPRSLAQQEEDNIQRAIEASRRDVADLPELEYDDQHEAGVLGADGTEQPHFGPATQAHYDADSWGMVRLSDTHAVPPSQRKRQPTVPAFISGGDIGGYLTILHSIPGARNLLLKLGKEPQTCPHSPQWWNGELESTSAPVQDSDEEVDREGPSFNEMELEIKRLMAFLDNTERSYASSKIMSHHLESNVFDDVSSPAERFNAYLNWGIEDDELKKTFCSAVESRLADGRVVGKALWSSLQAKNERDESRSMSTLYELLDLTLWERLYDYNGAEVTSVLTETAGVFTVVVDSTPNAGMVEIPEVFYPERWLESRFEEALKIQKALQDTRKSYIQASKTRMALPTFSDPMTGMRVRKREYLDQAQARFGMYRNYLEGRARFRTVENSAYEVDRYPDYRLAEFDFTAEETVLHEDMARAAECCTAALKDHESKTIAANSNLEKIRAKQRSLGHLLTEPNKPGRPKPMTCKKYTLRGIATDAAVYLRQKTDEDLIELGDVRQTTESQWWRLAHDAGSNPYPVTTELLSFEEMHSRVWTDSERPLIVYSTDEAMHAPTEALPPALERFVKVDNKAFRQELQQEEAAEDPQELMTLTHCTSPSKRKHRDSIDSMASNRPSVGDSERDPFASDWAPDSEADEPSRKRRSPQDAASYMDEDVPPPLPQRPGSAQPMEVTLPVIEGVEPDEAPVREIHIDKQATQSSESKVVEMQERQQAGITQFLPKDRDKSSTADQQDLTRMDLV